MIKDFVCARLCVKVCASCKTSRIESFVRAAWVGENKERLEVSMNSGPTRDSQRHGAIRRLTRVILIIVISSPFIVCAASKPETAAPAANHDFSDRIAEAFPLQGDIALDGLLDEPAWQQCVPITELFQQQPAEGEPVSEKTEIRVLYSAQVLYVGVTCFDRAAQKIVARKMRREESTRGDLIFSDDSIHIVIDAFANGQNAFMFSTNPLGARYDALIAGFNRSQFRRLSSTRQAAYPQPSWNGLWNVKTQQHADGWTAEFAIPFSTLRFPDQTEQTWSINFSRRIARKNEQALWSAHPKDLGLYSLVHAGKLVGLAHLDQGRGLDFKPYALGNYDVERDPRDDEDLTADGGFDLSYSITSDMRLDLAVNPDFAETEVDAQPLNLDRFPLFFPEKRRFFLEGSNIFSVGNSYRILPFHSRRIGMDDALEPMSIIEGTKITGTARKTSFGILNALTSDSGDTPMTVYNVMRAQQRILNESNVGMIMTSKMPHGGMDNHVVGVDGSFMMRPLGPDKRVRADFLALQSFSEREDGDDLAGHVVLLYPNDPWDVSVEYLHIGPDFNPELGFVRQTGIDRWGYSMAYTPESDLPWLRRTAHSLRTKYAVDEDFEQFQDYIRITPLGLLFESGDYVEYEYVYEGDNVKESFDIFKDISIAPGHHHYGYHTIDFRSTRKRRTSVGLEYTKGQSLNGRRQSYEVDGILQLTRHLDLALEGEIDQRDYPVTPAAAGVHGGEFTARLARFRATYAFNPDMYLSSFLQWENESELISVNTRFRWTIEPERELFVVLNLGGNRATETFMHAGTAVKLAYNWRF